MPIRIALAIVSGCSTGAPAHQRRGSLGLEAEHPRSRPGLVEPAPVRGDVAGVADRDAERVELPLERLRDLERGRLLPLDPELVDRVDQRHRVAAGELTDELQRPSKFPRSAITRAPCTSAWASFPVAIFPSGTITAHRSPPRAAYAAADAAVLPVEAQMIAREPSLTAADTAQVIPRSLNEPVGLAPSSFSHTSAPTRSDSRGARTSGVDPSSSDTTGSPGSNGSRSR